jgi:serine/threonine protein kinase
MEPAKREAYLKEACPGDESLREEVEALLEQQAKAQGFLNDPAIEDGAKALARERENMLVEDLIGRTIPHYRIVEKIGEGGMGVVYKARDAHLDRTVAIKVLPADAMAHPERKRRLVQEARASSALNHPGIVQIHDINSDGGVDFIVMEYVAGMTLDRRIGRKGLRIGEALKYGVQIADALVAAHVAGIVHRDLKPANIYRDGSAPASPNKPQAALRRTNRILSSSRRIRAATSSAYKPAIMTAIRLRSTRDGQYVGLTSPSQKFPETSQEPGVSMKVRMPLMTNSESQAKMK